MVANQPKSRKSSLPRTNKAVIALIRALSKQQ